uniref:hypothetical protein n=1 Tax=Arhodomonas aquaeolei TaxID=2369 RepID=UPI0035B5B8E7
MHAGASRYDGVTIEFRPENDERYEQRLEKEKYDRTHIGDKSSRYYSDQDRLKKEIPLREGHILV